MNKKILGLGLSMALLFISCENDETPTPDNGEQQSNFNISRDASELQSSINFDETGVIGVTNINNTRNQEAASVFGIEQIAHLEPPMIGDQALRATHVDVKGDYAYVSYNKEGATYLGAIDIVDIRDKYNPELISRLTTSIADINSLFVDDNGYLVFTGASAKDNGGPGKRSLMGYIELENGDFSNTFDNNSDVDPRTNPISNLNYGNTGNAGVHILPFNGQAISISGDAGDITLFTYPGTLTAFGGQLAEEIEDLRYAAIKNNTLAVLSGVDGLMNFTVNENFVLNSKISTAPLTAESKRTIAWYGDNVLVSEGSQGAGIYNFEAGAKLTSLPIKTHPDALENNPEDKVTNAVSTDGDFIYMANGGAGLDILKLNDQLNPIIEGIAEINGSANYVEAKGDYVFVASGLGLKILKISKPKNDAGSSEYFAMCAEYLGYDGNPNFNVNSNEVKNYSGSATVNHLNVNGKLTFCGSINSKHGVNVNSNGEFNMSGSMAVGRYGKREDLNINSNSTLRINGSLTVYSNLNLNSGATLEFVGENSTIHVFGEVRKGNNVIIKGDYTDTSGKL